PCCAASQAPLRHYPKRSPYLFILSGLADRDRPAPLPAECPRASLANFCTESQAGPGALVGGPLRGRGVLPLRKHHDAARGDTGDDLGVGVPPHSGVHPDLAPFAVLEDGQTAVRA